MRNRWAPALLLLLLGLALLLVAACDDDDADAPQSGATAPSTAAAEDGFTPEPGTENVGFVVQEDQLVLSGRLFGRENEVAVVLAHMLPNDQRAWFPFARELAQNGYAAFTFDFRGFGNSPGDRDLDKLDEDLTAAIGYLRDRGKERIFLLGASMGGTASLVVAASQPVQGVVAISAPAEFESQNALEAVVAVSAPKLFIASEGDESAAISLEELLEAANAPKDAEVYPGNAHGTALFESEHSAAVRERILEFLDEHRD